MGIIWTFFFKKKKTKLLLFCCYFIQLIKQEDKLTTGRSGESFLKNHFKYLNFWFPLHLPCWAAPASKLFCSLYTSFILYIFFPSKIPFHIENSGKSSWKDQVTIQEGRSTTWADLILYSLHATKKAARQREERSSLSPFKKVYKNLKTYCCTQLTVSQLLN